MRKISKKRTSKAASVSNESDDDSSVKDKKVRNGAGKKDGANDSDSEDEKNHKNGEDNDRKSKSKSRKKSKEQSDDKKKRKHRSKDESDESSGSASDDEALSKIAKTSKKSDTSSKGKEKGKENNKERSKKQDESVDEDADEEVDEEYEVEDIISHKRSHGRMLYLIRWKGYGADDDTWEKSATLDNCPEILKKYTDEHPDSTPPPSSKKSSKTNKKEKNRKKFKEIAVEEFDENADYEVEKIIDVFFKKDKSREFLVRWKGYRSESDSWEPEEHLNCPDLIEKYMAKVEHAKNLSEKELRPHRKHTERFTLRTQENSRRLSKRHEGKQRAVYYDAED